MDKPQNRSLYFLSTWTAGFKENLAVEGESARNLGRHKVDSSGAIFVGFLKNVKNFVIFPRLSEVNPDRFPKDLGGNPEDSRRNGAKYPVFREFVRF
jgi:hypothetical protein